MSRIYELSADDVDDFDFPLVEATNIPGSSRGQTGTHMAGLSSMLAGMMGAGMTGGSDQQTSHGGKDADRARTKHWETIYPRYLDAKAPCKTGARRVALKYSLRWPLAQLIHHACTQMGLPSHLEIDKVHPADWQNPGRVKVMIKRNGKPINGSIKNKYALLCKIGTFLRPLESARLKLPAVTETTTAAAAAGGPLEPPIGLRLPYNSPAVSHGFLAMAESETDASSSLTTPDHNPSSLKTKPSQEPKKSIKPNPAQKKNKKKHKK